MMRFAGWMMAAILVGGCSVTGNYVLDRDSSVSVALAELPPAGTVKAEPAVRPSPGGDDSTSSKWSATGSM